MNSTTRTFLIGILLVIAIIFGALRYTTGIQSTVPQSAVVPANTEGAPTPTPSTPMQKNVQTNEDAFASCVVFSRRNMNTYGSNPNMLDDRSELRCNNQGTWQTMVTVKDKAGSSASAHSIYRFWKDENGYRLLIVDTNGAGSGEGIGKLVTLFNDSAVLNSCFSFLPEDFSVLATEKWNTPLSEEEYSAIKRNLLSNTSAGCSNYTITSFVR